MMQTLMLGFSILGLLSLFLLGLRALGDVLLERSGDRARVSRTVPRFSSDVGVLRRFLGGFGATGLTASRPAAFIELLVSVDSRRLFPAAAMAPLVGINLGMTVHLWILIAVLRVPFTGELGLLLLACALPFRLGLVSENRSGVALLVGAGLLLTALGYLTDTVPAFLAAVDAPAATRHLAWPLALPVLVAVAAGAAAAAWVTGSSLGLFAITLVFVSQGQPGPEVGATAILAANLGGAIAGVSSVRSFGPETVKVARAHILFNLLVLVVGLVLVIGVAHGLQFDILPAAASPAEVRFAAGSTVGLGLLVTLAMLASAAFTALAPHLVHHLRRVAPGAGGKSRRAASGLSRGRGQTQGTTAAALAARGERSPATEYELRLVRFDLPDGMEANLHLIRQALARMAEIAGEMLMIAMNAGQIPEHLDEGRERCAHLDEALGQLAGDITAAVGTAVRAPCTPAQALQLQREQQLTVELRNIGLDIAKLLRVLERSRRKGYRPHKESRQELFDITAQVLDFLEYDRDYLSGRLEGQDPQVAQNMEKTIDAARDRLRKHARKTMEKESGADVRGELAFIQAVGYLERIGDRCLAMSRAITQLGAEPTDAPRRETDSD